MPLKLNKLSEINTHVHEINIINLLLFFLTPQINIVFAQNFFLVSVSYRDFNVRFFVSKVAVAEPTFHVSLCIIISPVQQNICGINSVSVFTLRITFCSSFVPDARDTYVVRVIPRVFRF